MSLEKIGEPRAGEPTVDQLAILLAIAMSLAKTVAQNHPLKKSNRAVRVCIVLQWLVNAGRAGTLKTNAYREVNLILSQLARVSLRISKDYHII